MFIYSVQCEVNAEVADAWEKYFIEVHLDDVRNTGCFTSYTFKKEVLENGKTLYVADYYFASLEDLDRYNQEFAFAMKKDILDKFTGQFTAKRNVFEILTEKKK